MTTLQADKDPDRLRGVDIVAHQAFRAFEIVHGRAVSSSIDEPVTVVPADPAWPIKFRQEAERIRAVALATLVPDIQHIGSTAVAGLDGKPIVDIMVGLSEPTRIGELVPALEKLRYESLGEAGVPGRWALRRREIGSHFNISIIAFGGTRWRQNLNVRDFLINDREAASRYAVAKWAAVTGGAATLFAYSNEKHLAMEAIVTTAERYRPVS